MLVDGNDACEVATLFPGWQLDLIQLSRGQARVSGALLALDGFQFIFARFHLKAILRVTSPRDTVALVMVPDPSQSLRSGSHRVGGMTCLALGTHARTEIVLPAECCIGTLLYPATSGRQDASLAGQFPGRGRVRLGTLAADAAELLVECTRRASTLTNGSSPGGWINPFPPRPLETIATRTKRLFAQSTSTRPKADATTRRRRAVARACTHINAHLRTPLTLRDLCDAAGMGGRSLEYGFQESYGIGPMAYLKCIRLGRVRRDLVASQSTDDAVAKTARRWRFAHMGQFSRDYRNQFGESPSVTLGRSRAQRREDKTGSAVARLSAVSAGSSCAPV